MLPPRLAGVLFAQQALSQPLPCANLPTHFTAFNSGLANFTLGLLVSPLKVNFYFPSKNVRSIYKNAPLKNFQCHLGIFSTLTAQG